MAAFLAIPLWALIAAGLGALGLGFGAWRYWSWLFGAKPPEAAKGRARIMVVGRTGVGKSTLINAMLGEQVAEVGEGPPQTANTQWLTDGAQRAYFADTQGLELARAGAQLRDLDRVIARWPAEWRPHVAWVCVRQDSARVFGGAEPGTQGIEAELAACFARHGIPVIVAITQADDGPLERNPLHDHCRRVFPDAARILPVNAVPQFGDGVELVPRHGLRDLHAATLDLLPEPPRAWTAAHWPRPA